MRAGAVEERARITLRSAWGGEAVEETRPRDTGCRGEEQRRRRPFARKRACGASSCWTAALRSAVRSRREVLASRQMLRARGARALSKRAAVVQVRRGTL